LTLIQLVPFTAWLTGDAAVSFHAGSGFPFPAQVRSIAEPEEVARRWRSVLAAHPGSARLWREYLAFRRAAFATFGVAAVRREYEDALEVLVQLTLTVNLTLTLTLTLAASLFLTLTLTINPNTVYTLALAPDHVSDARSMQGPWIIPP